LPAWLDWTATALSAAKTDAKADPDSHPDRADAETGSAKAEVLGR
jgi:hypothetical protein